jgi:hypothetical protein
MNVSALLKEAKMNAVALQTCPAVHQGYLNRINALKESYTTTLALVVKNFSAYKTGDNTTTYGNDVAQLAGIEADLHELIETINTSVVGVKKLADDAAVQMDNVTAAQGNLALGDPDKLDSTSRRTMLDFADQYRLAYYVVWVKVVLIVGVVYFLYSQENLLLSGLIFVAITLLWYVGTFLLAMYRGRNPGGGDTDAGKMCGDGVTLSDETGSNCPAVCTAETYVACNKGVYGKCCWNGTPFTDATGSACPLAPSDPESCFNSAYGCCSDGKTKRQDPTGTYLGNVDKYGCAVVADCKTSEFGCCPNGTARTSNEDDCTFQSPCAFSAFGCCEDGSSKSNAAGSACPL